MANGCNSTDQTLPHPPSPDTNDVTDGTDQSLACSTKEQSSLLRDIVSPNPNDIICGRGLHITTHDGNFFLHQTVSKFRQRYTVASRKEKADITKQIVQQIKSTGARFIRRSDEATGVVWVEVDNDVAYSKVGHALRRRKQHVNNFSNRSDNNQQQLNHLEESNTNRSQPMSAGLDGVTTMLAAPLQHNVHLSRMHQWGNPLATTLPSLQYDMLQLPVHQLPLQLPSQLPSQLPLQFPLSSSARDSNALVGTLLSDSMFAHAFGHSLATLTGLQQQQQQQQQHHLARNHTDSQHERLRLYQATSTDIEEQLRHSSGSKKWLLRTYQ